MSRPQHLKTLLSRRQRLLAQVGDGIALIPTAPEQVRNRDTHHPYRFDSYFWYLTGFPEPEAVLVLAGGRSILFCREKDEEREIWDGFRYGPEAARLAFGFDEAWPITSLEEKLPQLMADRPALWHALGHDPDWDARIGQALNAVRSQARAGKRPPTAIHDLRQVLDAMRLTKDEAELEIMQRAADITRTFPVNGRFSAAQKDCYEIVLAAQAAAIAATRPGAGFMAPHDAAVRVLVQGMVDLQLLTGSVDGIIESGAYKRFYMHRTGHWLGLDVHDAGEYKSGEDWMPLAPGMVLTVEPGLYIRPGAEVPEHLHGIGIRIEDDVIVTPEGCRVYTRAPKTVAEIEEVMAHD